MLKESKLPAYFTVDAGPNVHVVCEENDEQKVAELFNEWKIIINKPAAGAHVI
jgi:mevalonate pyrophosphate decarboxylase